MIFARVVLWLFLESFNDRLSPIFQPLTKPRAASDNIRQSACPTFKIRNRLFDPMLNLTLSQETHTRRKKWRGSSFFHYIDSRKTRWVHESPDVLFVGHAHVLENFTTKCLFISSVLFYSHHSQGCVYLIHIKQISMCIISVFILNCIKCILYYSLSLKVNELFSYSFQMSFLQFFIIIWNTGAWCDLCSSRSEIFNLKISSTYV